MPGIDDMAFYVPGLYLPIATLAEKRNIEYAKLNKGLGLEAMALPDVHEDAATMAANAVRQLIVNNQLSPKEIGRIYVGSESATDGSKPIASYILSMLSDYFADQFGENAFRHTDVVDMTFACIGGVDALHNTLDWVRADRSRKGIVVCTDAAKYELGSTGEYTQGAGAVAMLVTANPRLIEIDSAVGISAVGVHDFFKPLRRVAKKDLVEVVTGVPNPHAGSFEIPNVIFSNEEYIDIHKIYPVFDGQYSNQCYTERMNEAYEHFAETKGNHQLADWDRIVFHLPYAFHGKRVFTDIYYASNENNGQLQDELKAIDAEVNAQTAVKLVGKTNSYRTFVNEKIEKGQRASSLIGNMYTASIFMALMSTLESELQDGAEMTGKKIGFCSYGSGSKSKVFEGTLQPNWKEVTAQFALFDQLSQRKAIDFDTYEKLHSGQLKESLLSPKNEFFLQDINTDGLLYGERSYAYAAQVMA